MALSSPRSGKSAIPPVPLDWPEPAFEDDDAMARRAGVAREHRRKLAETLNVLVAFWNSVDTLTLSASVASTTLSDARIGRNTVVLYTPTTANGSAEIGNGTIYQTYPNATEGQAVINHANNAQTDRTFAYALVG